MSRKRSLSGDLIDFTVAAVIAGPAISIVGTSGLPAPLITGTQSLIGVGLLKGAADLLPEEKRNRRFEL